MGNFRHLNSKAQVSVEFMLIVMIIILYVVNVIQPIVVASADSAEDVARISQINFAAEKLASSVSYVHSLPGESWVSINLFIPAGSKIECDTVNCPSAICYSADISSDLLSVSACVNSVCKKNISLPSGISLICSSAVNTSLNGGLQVVRIRKDSSGDVHVE